MMSRALLLCVALGGVRADVYMQYPPGSNNRLDEGGGNRNNNNRLMDTQNNAKGGYGYGGSANNKAPPLKYMVNSKLSMSWTSQHSCGSENAECQIVIQYMCNSATTPPTGVPASPAGPGEGPIRDGTDGNTPDPNNPDANRGLHEPTSFYQACANRERNKGLYIADQNLNNGQGARATRQNPNGARSGLECPEERDYYPYWAPTPWKDLMIMTNNLKLCPFYQENSQNVASKYYCAGGNTGNNNQDPNNEQQCTTTGGTWTEVPAHGIAPPECVAAPHQRDNHLGSADQTGYEVAANLSIPLGAGPGGVNDATNCVMRLRYNITTADTRACSDPTLKTRAACEAAGADWASFYLDSSYNDQNLNDDLPLPDGNPTIDIKTGQQVENNNNNNLDDDALLELAINTNQYGRTFQDRTHVFSIQDRPARIPDNVPILNLNVKGKRGNIVQTYPAVEYDFHPTVLVAGTNEMVHVQWTGNDNTNNNGNNNGEGTNNEDRHNIVQLDNTGMDVPLPADQATMFDVAWEWNPETPGSQFGGARDKTSLLTQFSHVKQTNCLAHTDIQGDQQRQNCQKLNAAAATVDLGLVKFKPGTYKYMSSRNNNFSNRAQKARLEILNDTATTPAPPVNVVASPLEVSGKYAKVEVTWAPPGSDMGTVGTDGKVYWGKSQAAGMAMAYSVQYSCDGGASWHDTSCRTVKTSCTVEGLPTGTPCAFRVNSWSAAEGAPSTVALAQTPGKSAGSGGLDTGMIFLIVFLSLAGAGILAGLAVYLMRSDSAVPPPPWQAAGASPPQMPPEGKNYE